MSSLEKEKERKKKKISLNREDLKLLF